MEQRDQLRRCRGAHLRDLIIIPILVIYRNYYGTKMVLTLLGISYATRVTGGVPVRHTVLTTSGEGMIAVPEDLPPSGTPATPGNSGAHSDRQDLRLADATRLTETIVGHITEQARSTASAAKAGRLTKGEGEPGVLDVTPLRELLTELAQELQRLRTRERIAWALRQAADIIDPQTPSH